MTNFIHLGQAGSHFPGVAANVAPKPMVNPPKPAELAIVETSTGDKQARLKVDSQVINLPESAEIKAELLESGAGLVTVSFNAKQIRVIPADKRATTKRLRDRKKPEGKTNDA